MLCTVEDMEAAAQKLLKEPVIAVDLEGHLARKGRISLVQIGTRAGAVFIFDTMAIGEYDICSEAAYSFKALLESSKVLKVLHDCRRDSEALFYVLGIRLQHVLDTQAAWALLHPAETRRAGLNVVLLKYASNSRMTSESVEEHHPEITPTWHAKTRHSWRA